MKKKNLTFIILFLISIKPIHCQEINHVQKEQKNINKLRSKYLMETVYLIDSLVQLTYYDISKRDTTLVKTFIAKKICDSFIYEGKSFGYSNNKLSEINNYVNGKKEGVELSFSIDQNFIEYSKEYRNDTIDGVYIRYYENGNIREVGKCYLFTNFKYGKWIYFYENGNVESIREYGVININDEPIMSNVQTNDLHINKFNDYTTVKIGSWYFYDTDNSVIKQHDFIHPEILIE